MTEARGDLQEAPREGAADLVACASVTAGSLPPAESLCINLLTFGQDPLPETVEVALWEREGTRAKGNV